MIAESILAPLLPGTPPASLALTPKAGGQLTVLCPTDVIALDPQLDTTDAGARIYSNRPKRHPLGPNGRPPSPG